MRIKIDWAIDRAGMKRETRSKSAEPPKLQVGHGTAVFLQMGDRF
ncbi:MAG: hypothetical protein WBA89_14965 [Microcoleus sp.]